LRHSSGIRLFVILVVLLCASDALAQPAASSSDQNQQTGGTPTSPLAIHVGDADLLIGGFMDATVVMRSTATGNGISTSFGTIPFGNTPQGNLSETKLSAQNSRVSLQATSKLGNMNIKGYLEVDFLGNAPNGLNVTSNADTLRMRLYWAQLTNGKFEFLAGQTWSFLVPSRNGISPMPADLFYSQVVDTNYQMGLTWTRALEFRFVAHPSELVTAGVALENPEQYVGSAVVLPAAFPTFEVDNGGVTTTTPNLYPDIIGKIAFDPKTGSTHQHIDAAVLVRGFKTYNPTTNESFTETATGGEIGVNVEPVKNLHIVGTGYFSNGGGRYIANTNGPDFIVNVDHSMSLVKSQSYIVGPELTVKKTLLYGYYSHAKFDQNVTTDTNGKPIGYGIPGSTAANHTLNEYTAGLTQTFFRDPKIGGVQLMFQYSYVDRTPFSVPAGTPTKAKTNMAYVNVRYILP
jgi:hypothetical protein